MYNDYELLYLAQENNEDAVNELRKKYNSLLYAKALSYSRSSHMDIKELLNETELAFYKAIDNYIDKNTFNTYLNKVIDNNLTNYIAKHNVTKNKSGARNMWDLRGRSPSLRSKAKMLLRYPSCGAQAFLSAPQRPGLRTCICS